MDFLWHGMLYTCSCTYMATVNVKRLIYGVCGRFAAFECSLCVSV